LSFGKRGTAGQFAFAKGYETGKGDTASSTKRVGTATALKATHSSNKWGLLGIVVIGAAVAAGFFVSTLSPHSSITVGKMWVTASRLAEYSCPSVNCGVVDRLKFSEVVDVLEVKGAWARVTDYYDASCRSHRSRHIYEGNDSCSPDNGIVNGKVANWTQTQGLSPFRPADPN
jgi:hypothetical protein